MRKNIFLGGIFILSLVFLFGFAVAGGGDPYELSQNHTNIATSAGTLTLIEGSMVGGEPSNYITLNNQETLQTTTGPETFTAGAKIDCDHELGAPDPCNAY